MSSTKRNINGILLLDKPLGLSSNHALQKVKRLFQAQKAGHTGVLDPLASGLLPLCFGEATKFSQHLLDSDKTYEVEGILGQQSSTGDGEGEIIATNDISHLTPQAVTTAIEKFIGPIAQIPPMHSALKLNGQPLYKLARKGIEIERKARDIVIHSITIDSIDLPRFRITVSCSKGTYIRSLIEDIGNELNVGAYVSVLRRLKTGPFDIASSYTLDTLMELGNLDSLLLPIDSAILDLPTLSLSSEQTFFLRRGQQVFFAEANEQKVRLTTNENEFIGIGEVIDNYIVPRRLVSTNA
jgi:tRNA pseudouridine55 synthase